MDLLGGCCFSQMLQRAGLFLLLARTFRTLPKPSAYLALTSMTLEQALATAPKQRPDYQSADARVRAAEDSVKAAQAQRHPTAGVTADYGDVGTTPNNSHGTFTFTASASINLFDGRRIEGDIVQAALDLHQYRVIHRSFFSGRADRHRPRICGRSAR